MAQDCRDFAPFINLFGISGKIMIILVKISPERKSCIGKCLKTSAFTTKGIKEALKNQRNSTK